MTRRPFDPAPRPRGCMWALLGLVAIVVVRW